MSEGKIATEEENKSANLNKLPELKTIREARGVRIEDISRKTMISITILNAIENGEFHLLPAPVYAKKFIRIYAEAIGVDADSILVHFQRYVDGKKVAPEKNNVVKMHIIHDRKLFKRHILYAIAAVAIIAAVLIIYPFFHGKVTFGTGQPDETVDEQKHAVPGPAPAVNVQPPAAAPTVPQAPPATVAAPKETAQTPDNTRLDLLIEATEDTWLNIVEDRNPPFQTILKKGDKLNRKAREYFVIDVGNAAGVNITFLGTSLGTLGRKGQVVHLRLPLH